MKVLIGCPVYDRAWILPSWFEAIENQSIPLSDLGFIFELGPNDDETHDSLWNWQQTHPEVAVFDAVIREDVVHRAHPEGKRIWHGSDYEKMCILRNHLLDRATCLSPDRYLSLDCDLILEDPQSIEYLYNLTETRDAVSPLMYMFQTDMNFPSVMSWVESPGGPAKRTLDQYPMGTLFKADIIMAGVMMSEKVYKNARYQWHKQGEDLGWSANCAKHGFDLYCASNLYVPHIMHRWFLDEYKQNGDPRGENILCT